MTQIRLQGPTTGSNLGTVSVTVDTRTASVDIPAFSAAAPMHLPLIAGPQADGDTAVLDTSRLNNLTSIQWRVRGGENLGTATTQDLSGLGGSWVEAETVSDEGTLVSPPLLVHALMMTANHNRDDAAAVALASHNKMTRVAAQDGNWSDTQTWVAGSVPQHGDSVLIPHGVEVNYDVDAPNLLIRRLRVDGTFRLATDANTHMYVRDIIVDRMGLLALGNSATDRINSSNKAILTFDGKSLLDIVEDPTLLSRGIVSLGAVDVFGAEMLNHSLATEGVPQGATSLTLEKAPVGWDVGTKIIVGGTAIQDNFTIGEGLPQVVKDEIVTITGISGNAISFTPALANPHNDQNDRKPYNKDVRPMVQLRAESRNLILQAESLSPVTQRPHVMIMHMHSRQNVHDVGLIGLGRTIKGASRLGVLNDDGAFKTYQFNSSTNKTEMVEVPLTNDANMRGRYPWHSHVVGWNHSRAGRPIPQVVNMTVDDSPGWGIVHHDCEMTIRGSSTFRVYGCGIVSEQGGETGVWDDLSAMQATAVNLERANWLQSTPKGHHAQWHGIGGDHFNDGYGFGYRSRAIKVTRCVATSCSWGHVFWHRSLNAGNSQGLFDLTHLPRNTLDLQEVGLMNTSSNNGVGNFSAIDYPIVHFADCMSIGCMTGMYVAKDDPRQNHDFSVIWKNPTAFGSRFTGIYLEYVSTYILVDPYVIDGVNIGSGIRVENNTAQIAVIRPRTEGCFFHGLSFKGSAVGYNADDFNVPDNPRFWVIGRDANDRLTDVGYSGGQSKTLNQVAVIEDDWDATYLDYKLDPSETFPDIVGTWARQSANTTITKRPDNTDGLKFGNHPVGLPISDKAYGDSPFPRSNFGSKLKAYAENYGYNQYQGSDVVVQREIISDVPTGRPAKFTALWQADSPITSGIDNGPITLSSAIVAGDIEVTVEPGGSVTFDAIAGATGGTGTFEIDPGDFTAPDYGALDINYSTGEVTYTPREGVSNQSDFGYLFIRSQRETGVTGTETRTYATRRISVVITSNATLAAPARGTDFTLQSNTGNTTFAVNMMKLPQSGGRRILTTQYSTDGGTNWRRLCNGWPRTAVSVALESDGSVLTAGSLNVRLRYLTDHEYGFSPQTPDLPVVVG
ncbi:G8 domain-containing protein [Cognatiyoonia koreensis]|uniref:G8 domain-containing protein n=1 Tax=Cognatiyoonia koreensis TaxID=364200 RepID=A0A1I0RTB7_9RHOB|nr:G8 domain-containing protein [Cognatiyoonia koreensis]SEW44436.1 G8 domain-containing protein [Cognatiyoonia koreensis]